MITSNVKIALLATLLFVVQSALSSVEVVFLDNYFGKDCNTPNLGAPFALGNACNKLGSDFSAEIACDATTQQASIELFFNSSTCEGTPDESIAGCVEGHHHEFSTGISCSAIPGDDVAFVTIGKSCNESNNQVSDHQFTLLLILNECNPLPDFSNYASLDKQEDVPSGSFIITVNGEELTLNIFLDSEYEINGNCTGTPSITRVGKFGVCSVQTEGRLLANSAFGNAISFATTSSAGSGSGASGSNAGAAVGGTIVVLGVVGAAAFVAFRRKGGSVPGKNQLTASTGNPTFNSGMSTQTSAPFTANNQHPLPYEDPSGMQKQQHQYGQQYAPQFGYGGN
jgi:hypothetical protein